MPVVLPNSIFYHIPKTGGMFVTDVLKRIGLDYFMYEPDVKNEWNLRRMHTTPDDVPYNIEEDRKRWTFVRNPYTWYQSMFAYRANYNWGDDKTFVLDEKCKADNFNEFVKRVCYVFPDGFLTIKYKKFLGKDLKKMDFIGRQENLRSDLIKVLKRYEKIDKKQEDFILNAQKINASASLNEWKDRVIYDGDTKKLLRKVESWIFDNLNYET